MRRDLLALCCLTMLMAPIADATAQNGHPHPAATSSTTNAEEEYPRERRELREERQQLIEEREDLEAEHDRLKVECMNTKGQERSACVKQKTDLHERMDDWHRRMQAFREKTGGDNPPQSASASPPPHQ